MTDPIKISKENYLFYVKNANQGLLYEGMALEDLPSKLKGNKNINKILLFINNDEDKKVTNEVECIILRSLINGSDKVKMPEKGDYKFVTDEFVFSKDGQKTIFSIEQKDGSYDKLVDEDGDGYADYRITANFKKIDLKGLYKRDDNLDGIFDEQY